MLNINSKNKNILFNLFFIFFISILAYLNTSISKPTKTDWHENINSKIRIIMPEVIDQNLYIGLEITLDDGTYTYWSNPGDSGIQPLVTLSSKSIRKYNVLWPVPEIIKDEYGTNYGYFGNNIIPIKISLANTKDIVDLDLHYSLGVCNVICIPIDGKIRIEMPDSYNYYKKKSSREIENALQNIPVYRNDEINLISSANLKQIKDTEIIILEFLEPIEKIFPMTSKKFYLIDIEDTKDSYISYSFSYSPKRRSDKINGESFSVIIFNDGEFFIEDFILD